MSEQEAAPIAENNEPENNNTEEPKEDENKNVTENEEGKEEKDLQANDANTEEPANEQPESTNEEATAENIEEKLEQPQENENEKEKENESEIKEETQGNVEEEPKEEVLPEDDQHVENSNNEEEEKNVVQEEEKKEEPQAEATSNENEKPEEKIITPEEKPEPKSFTMYLLFDLKLREHYKDDIEKWSKESPQEFQQPEVKPENRPAPPPPEPLSYTKYIMFDRELDKLYNPDKYQEETVVATESLEDKKESIAAALLGSDSDSESNSDHENEEKPEEEEVKAEEANTEEIKDEVKEEEVKIEETVEVSTRSIESPTPEEEQEKPKTEEETPNTEEEEAPKTEEEEKSSMILTTSSIATLELSPVEPDSPPRSPRSQYRPRPPHTPPASPRRSVRARSVEVAPQPQLSDSEVERLKAALLKGEPIKDLADSESDQLLHALVEERNAKAAENNFKESQRYQRAVDTLTNQQMKRRKASAQKEVLDQLESQLQGKRDELAEFDRETEALVKQFKEDKDAQRKRMEESHQEQLDKHAAEWTADKKVRQYNRASHGLINLRKQFKLLVQQCRFSDASDVRAIIERTEAEEKAIAHAQMQHDFDESLRKLEAKQDGEREFLESNAVVQLAQLQQKRARLRVAFVNKLKKVEAQAERAQDPEKVWNSLQMQRLEQASSVQPRGTGQVAATTTKVTISTGSTREDATISLPPLNVKRTQRGQTRKSQRTPN